MIIDGPELSPDAAAWAGTVLDIGGLLVRVLPPMADEAMTQHVRNDRLLLSEKLVPARHYVHVLPRSSRSKAERWLVTSAGVEVLAVHKSHLLMLSVESGPDPLKAWLERKECDADVCELNGYLKHPAEINGFLRRIKGGDLLESVRSMPIPPHVRYVGRWLKDATPCRTLNRLEVDPSGSVRCCRHGNPIGFVGDSREKLVRSLSTAIRKAAKRRGCESCTATHCPRCPFPGVPDQTYCSIMKTQVRALEFLGMLHLCSRLPVLLATLAERSDGG